jgi:hypothetical protein
MRKPKFQIGQVVAITGMDPVAYEQIKKVNPGKVSYELDSGTFSDYELRPLTEREIGAPRGKS